MYKACLVSVSMALSFLATSVSFASPDAFEAKFLFFDEKGHQLSYKEIVSRMTNGKPNFLSSGIFDLDTLKAVALHTAYNDGRGWVTGFRRLNEFPRQGMMVHWNTKNTGYSSFLLDNEGRGFTEPGVYVFNERLALDAKKQFADSLAFRPQFVPSEQLKTSMAQTDECYGRLNAVVAPSLKGRIGQECLDLVAQDMRTLLAEIGRANAKSHADPAWGVTITPDSNWPVDDELRKVSAIGDIFHPTKAWLRVAMFGDGSDDWPRIRSIVEDAEKKQIRTLGQLFDSNKQANVSYSSFVKRVDEVLADPVLSRFTSWEIGNEVNGGWLGKGIMKKMDYAARAVKQRTAANRLCVTFFWYSTQDTLETSLFNWIHTNFKGTELESNINCVGLSVYTAQEPMGFLWDLATRKLAETFPGKEMMIGETDFVERPYYEGPAEWTAEQRKAAFITSRFENSFAIPNSIGGVFWWSFEETLDGDTPMRRALRGLFCSVYPELCPKRKRPSRQSDSTQ